MLPHSSKKLHIYPTWRLRYGYTGLEPKNLPITAKLCKIAFQVEILVYITTWLDNFTRQSMVTSSLRKGNFATDHWRNTLCTQMFWAQYNNVMHAADDNDNNKLYEYKAFLGSVLYVQIMLLLRDNYTADKLTYIKLYKCYNVTKSQCVTSSWHLCWTISMSVFRPSTSIRHCITSTSWYEITCT